MKKNIDFRDEWINKNEVINALTESNFDENDWINRLIAWGDTVFCIKKERESRYYVEFAGRVICTGINTFEQAMKLIEEKDWDLIRVVSAVMAEYIIWSKEQESIKTDAKNFVEEIVNEAIKFFAAALISHLSIVIS